MINPTMPTPEYDYLDIETGIGTLLKTGAGELNGIVLANAGTAWEVDIYDGTSSLGTSIAKIRGATLPNSLKFFLRFRTGLFIDTVKGTTVGGLTAIFK